MVLLHVHMPIEWILWPKCVKIDIGEVLVLANEVPRRNNALCHVLNCQVSSTKLRRLALASSQNLATYSNPGLWNSAIPDIGSQVGTEIRIPRIEGDISRHGHLCEPCSAQSFISGKN